MPQLRIVIDREVSIEHLEPTCPKCGTRRRDARACVRCGLAVERMTAYVRAGERVVDALLIAWRRAVENWDDDEGHDEILRLIVRHGAWAWGAARYREVLHVHSEDQMASRQLRRLERGIQASLFTSATHRDDGAPRPYRASVRLLVALIVLIALGVFGAYVRDRAVAEDAAGESWQVDLTPAG